MKSVGAPGRQPVWAFTLPLVAADKLAVITVSTALRAAISAPADGPSGDRGATVTTASGMVATAVRAQIEYDNWANENEDVASRLLKKFPDMDRKTWTKWRHRVDAARLEQWPPSHGIQLGAHLLGLLCEASPKRFGVEVRRVQGGRTQAYLAPSAATLELIDDVTARAEVARPLLMPMLIKPLPWRYEETQRDVRSEIQ